MKCLIKNLVMTMGTVFCLGLCSCVPSGQKNAGSLLEGLSIDQLNRNGMSALAPHYEMWAHETEMRVAIFYTPNDSSTALKSDLAYEEMANMQSWITGYQQSSGFLSTYKIDPVIVPEGAEAYLLTGKGPRIGGNAEPVDYRITLYVGPSDVLASSFGEALAADHLTMLNGHIYTETDAGYDSLDVTVKKAYGPAMETFKQKAKGGAAMYRVVLFNNCWSENLEQLVLSSMQEVSANDFSMIAQRGISNYHDFSAQISSLLVNLVQQQPWTKVLAGLKAESPRSSQINPVVREQQ